MRSRRRTYFTLAKQCLEVEPSDRPKDATALAEQVTGYLESVETKLRESEVERAGEAARVVEQKKRLRVTLYMGAAALSILLAGIAATAWQASEAKKQTLVAQAAKKEATDEANIARRAEKDARKAESDAVDAKQKQIEIARQRRRELYASDMQLADQLYNGQNGEQLRIEKLLASWIPVDDQEDLREFSWRYQWNRLHNNADVSASGCKGVAITPDNKMVVTDSNGLHEINENGMKHALVSWKLEESYSYFSPDGRWVAAKFDSGFELYDIESRRKVLSLPEKDRCSFSSNGKYFATWKKGAKVDSLAPDEDAIPVWRLNDGKAEPIAPLVVGEMKQLPTSGTALKLGSDGRSFLLRNSPDLIRWTQVGAFLDGNPEPVIWTLRGNNSCAWSPDGRVIAIATVGRVELRLTADVADKIIPGKLEVATHGKWIKTIRFSPDGKLLATGGDDGTIDLWDVSALANAAKQFETQFGATSEDGDSGRPSIQSVPLPRLIRTIKAHTNQISVLDSALGLSTDGTQIVALSFPLPGTARLWNLNKVRNEYEMDSIVEDLYGWTLQVRSRPSDVRGRDWFISQARKEDIVEGKVDSADRIAAVFDPDKGEWFRVDGRETWHQMGMLNLGKFGSKVRYKLENPDGEQHEATLRRQRRAADQSPRSFSVSFAPDGKNAILCDFALGATQLDLATNQATRYPEVGLSAAYSPDGRLVAIDSFFATSIRDVETGKELHRLDSLCNVDWSPDIAATYGGDLAFSPDGKFLAHASSFRYSTGQSDLNVWRTSDFKKIGGGPLVQKDSSMKAPIFSLDSSRLFVADHFGGVQIWDTSNWTQQEQLRTSQEGVVSMAISSDGKRLVTGSCVTGGDVCIWDLKTRKLLRRLSSPPVGYLTLSPDDRTLAVGCLNHNVVLWDFETGKQLQIIQTHGDQVYGVEFSPDGNRLASLSVDGVLRFWDADSTSEIEQDPKTLRALLRLGNWRLEQERYEEAQALFSKVIELSQKSPHHDEHELAEVRSDVKKALDNLARLQERLGRWDEALESRTELVRLEPENHFRQYRVASAHLFLEDEESFWQVWQQMFDRWGDTESAAIAKHIAEASTIRRCTRP